MNEFHPKTIRAPHLHLSFHCGFWIKIILNSVIALEDTNIILTQHVHKIVPDIDRSRSRIRVVDRKIVFALWCNNKCYISYIITRNTIYDFQLEVLAKFGKGPEELKLKQDSEALPLLSGFNW